MKTDYKFIPITKAKRELLDVVRELVSQDRTIAITKKGTPVAVLLSMEKFESLLETLDILSDPRTMRALRAAIREAGKGEWVSYEQVFGH
jgi:prevent-host-death family protein